MGSVQILNGNSKLPVLSAFGAVINLHTVGVEEEWCVPFTTVIFICINNTNNAMIKK